MMDLEAAAQEIQRLSDNIDNGVKTMLDQAKQYADAEHAYRRGKAVAWARCPLDDPAVKSGEREWTAARREAWVDAETADLRLTRDRADLLRDTAREAVRARRAQLSSLQTLLNAHQEEAAFVRTRKGDT